MRPEAYIQRTYNGALVRVLFRDRKSEYARYEMVQFLLLLPDR